jgi:hypothetical protein
MPVKIQPSKAPAPPWTTPERATLTIQLWVRTQNQSHSLTLQNNNTILHLKQKAQVKTDIPATEQSLTHRGRPLNDYNTLEECDILPFATIDLHVLLKGGMEEDGPTQEPGPRSQTRMPTPPKQVIYLDSHNTMPAPSLPIKVGQTTTAAPASQHANPGIPTGPHDDPPSRKPKKQNQETEERSNAIAAPGKRRHHCTVVTVVATITKASKNTKQNALKQWKCHIRLKTSTANLAARTMRTFLAETLRK